MKVPVDDTAAQLVAGHVKPLPPTTHAAHEDGQGTATTSRSIASSEAIAAEAYSLWLARGCRDGGDVQDWLDAEARLNGITHAEEGRNSRTR